MVRAAILFLCKNTIFYVYNVQKVEFSASFRPLRLPIMSRLPPKS